MIVCDVERCREQNINEPAEGRFTIEVDGYGDHGSEYSCYYCGDIGISCSNCDSDYWCYEHNPHGNGPGEVVTSNFSTDVVWINPNKEPQHVIN